MPVEADDQDLLARLNALRPSTVSLATGHNALATRAASSALEADADLTSRFARLKGAKAVHQVAARSTRHPEPNTAGLDAEHNPEDEQTLDELLAELSSSQYETVVANEDLDRARTLQRDALALLHVSRAERDNEPAVGQEHQSNDNGNEAAKVDRLVGAGEQARKYMASEQVADEERDLTEDQEAEEYIQQVLAGILFEPDLNTERQEADSERTTADLTRNHESAADPSGGTAASDLGEEGDEGDAITLPSAPTFVPVPSTLNSDSATFDLPSTPTSMPRVKPPTTRPSSNAKTPSAAEIDTWCIICTDDATLRCAGCDGDLYCGNCWQEGHRGEDAGYEERRHRATRFVKGSGSRNKQRTKLGAA